MSNRYAIIEADVTTSLPFDDNFFDACLCDPPYLLEFMGKEFDCQHKKMLGANDGQKMQAWHQLWAREVLRVLSCGAHILAFGGTRTYHRLASAAEDVGFEVRDMMEWIHGQGFPKGKSQLKPAQEPILVAAKPGKHTLNLDVCRIGTEKRFNPSASNSTSTENVGHFGMQSGEGKDCTGRWPANLILSHHDECNIGEYTGDDMCHPDCPVRMLDEQTIDKIHSAGVARDGSKNPRPAKKGTIDFLQGSERSTGDMYRFGDSGGASRFFYCAKVSPRERNLGGIDCKHPTLKPIALTTYLAKLLLSPDLERPTRIIVPFSGAGSEIIGCLLAGWDEVYGIENDSESIKWSIDRIEAAILELEIGQQLKCATERTNKQAVKVPIIPKKRLNLDLEEI